MKNIFEIFLKYGPLNDVIKRAEELLANYNNDNSSKIKPATTVFRLVGELKEYF